MKFVVVSSDVIYPDGAMEDYEFKFYLPFHGVKKPIYAIPGNHDWYNQLDSFCANFMEPARRPRVDARPHRRRPRLHRHHRQPASTTYIAQAADLRREYRIANGFQRAPFFEIHYPGFSFIAVDTGVIRRIDEQQSKLAAGRARTLARRLHHGAPRPSSLRRRRLPGRRRS